MELIDQSIRVEQLLIAQDAIDNSDRGSPFPKRAHAGSPW